LRLADAPERETSVVEADPSGTAASGTEPPRWLCVVALVPAAGVLALGSVGLLFAVNGWYRPALVFPIGVAVWIAVLALLSPLLRSSSDLRHGTGRSAQLCAAIGVVATIAITAWNMGNASTHVLIDRDGGSYSNTARWIARDGSLTVATQAGPFAQEPTVGFESLAVYETPGRKLQFQFAHLLPVVLAESYAIAGDAGLFHTPALLSGIAMLAFFVLAWRLFRRPLFALAAMLALSLSLPQVSFARDSYSEIPSQILLFTAVWSLVTPRVLPRWQVALGAGLFLGSVEATRVDGLVFLIGVPVIAALAWLRSEAADRRSTLRSITAFGVGLLPGLLLGLVDLARHSGDYWSALHRFVVDLGAATTASLVASVVLVAVWRFISPLIRRLPWKTLSGVAAWIVALTGFAAWLLRPRLQHLHGNAVAVVGLQQSEHLVVDATRTYAERSLIWMSWYLGALTIAFAIIGAALLVRSLLRGRLLHTFSAVALFVPGSLLYLYVAKAIPDHIWVTRRFLVAAIPALLLLALGLAAHMWSARSSRGWGRACRIGAVVFAITAIAYPAYTLRPVRSMAEETGYLALVHHTCDAVGPNAAVIVVEARLTDQVDDWFPQAIRGWCGADVAVSRGTTKATTLHRMARNWDAEGRKLFVVSPTVTDLRAVLPHADVKASLHAVDDKLLAPTLSHRPDAYRSQDFAVVVAAVPPV
jgi:hypothetical protein